jgi:DNA-3-methyladenine glycosylase I
MQYRVEEENPMPTRCPWPKNELAIRYHDAEWGVPVHDDIKHFEFLTLESAQAGLSWDTVLKKREHYREAFSQFNPAIVAQYTDVDLEHLLNNPGLIRNRAKLTAAIANARAFLDIQAEFGSFNRYIWQFVNGNTLHHACQSPADIPATSPESDALSQDLKKRGFKFVGSTICYAHMQAAGLINDHLIDCFRYPILCPSAASTH